jgi:uncharacterized protein (DUF697 family)
MRKMLERFWFGCGECHGADSCPMAEHFEQFTAPREGVAKLPIPLTAGLVFLLPLICAMLAAHWASTGLGLETDQGRSIAQGLGGLAGLLAGVGWAKLLLVGFLRLSKHLSRGGQ